MKAIACRRTACLLAAFLMVAVLPASSCGADEPHLSAAASGSDALSSVKEQIIRLAETEMNRNQITGMSIALADANGTLLTVGLGSADLDRKMQVDADTIFKIGSVSKLFTATAVMQLAESGKLDIDQPLQTYIPEFSIKTLYVNSDPITIRSMMTHRSGLPGNYLPEILNLAYPYFTGVVDDLKEEYAAYPPNHITAYSNLNSVLLGVVVERVSGQKFDDYVRSHILEPLEMNRSSFDVLKDMEPYLSKGYSHNKPAEDEICPSGVNPEGSLRSSADDMSRFMQMVLNNGSFHGKQILSEATLNAMLTPQPRLPLDLEGNGLDTSGAIGLNWFLYDDPFCGRIVMHPGGTRLFFSKMIILRDSGLGVIVMANSLNGESVVSKIATETLVAALKATNATAHNTAENNASPGNFLLEPLSGYFATGMGWMQVGRDGTRFRMTTQKYPYETFSLTETPEGWNSCTADLLGLFRVNNPELGKLQLGMAEISGEHVLLANSDGVLRIMGEKIDVTPIPPAWSKRCGHYFETGDNGLPGLGHEMVLRAEHGMIVGYLINKFGDKSKPFILTPVSDTMLMIRGLGRDAHEIIRVVGTGGEEKLSYEGLLFKK